MCVIINVTHLGDKIVARKKYSGPPEQKFCNKCNILKKIDDFPICGISNGFYRYRANCKECFNEKARKGRPKKRICKIDDNHRMCNSCGEIKENSSFSNIGKDNFSGKVYQNGVCLLCMKDRELTKKYGISLHDYMVILKKQNGVCAICNETNASDRNLAVDHDHITGKVRGLLCGRCNMGIGLLYADKDTQIMKNAIMYIENNL